MMKTFFLLFASLTCLCLISCEDLKHQELIIGAWKIDSTYTYYNGFDFTQRAGHGDWATYVYEKDGMMKELKTDLLRLYFFELPTKDTLVVSAARGGENTTFNILHLDRQRMILKKSKKPVFPGNSQERYEIRYFSRTPLPADSLTMFSDPRQ